MAHNVHLGVATVPLLVVLGCATPFCLAGSTSADTALLKRVTTLCLANKKAIESVECDYVCQMNSLQRRCRYARQGDRMYHASVDMLKSGARSMVTESSWDGQISFRRPDPGTLTTSRDRTDFIPSCPTPEVYLMQYLEQALGYVPRPDHRYRLLSAQQRQYLDESCLELTFEAEWLGGRLVSRHSRSHGHLPISVELFHADGTRVYELRDVRYAERHVAGNVVFYPVHFVADSYLRESNARNIIIYDVDDNTLKVNQPIARDRFSLQAWPSSSVVDLDNSKGVPAKDRNWSPVGQVGFPYDVFFTGAALGTVNGAGREMAAPSNIATLVSQHEARIQWLWWSVVGIGIAILVIGGFLRYRSYASATK
jgi:hypothetical protein